MPKPKKNPPAKVGGEERPVLYPTFASHIAVGEQAMTYDQIQDMLGWEETDDKDLAQFTDRNGKLIYCRNNTINRPINWTKVETLRQIKLRGHWEVNCEAIIVGKTGQVINGQKTLIAHALAEQDRLNDFPDEPEDLRKEYRKRWPNPITLEKFVNYGCEETDKVINTIDTADQRQLWEVLCRSPYFATMKIAQRKVASKICEHAIRMIWHRTGAGNAFNLVKTHDESIDFLERHPTLVACVKHVYEEDGGKDRKIASVISPGYAAGLLYLMAASGSESEPYYDSNAPSEKKLDFSNRDKAEEFWTFLATGDPEFKALRDAVASHNDPATGSAAPLAVKVAVLVKAWCHYISGDPFTAKRLELKFVDGRLVDDELVVGGIDRGPNPEDDEEEDELDGDKNIPSPEELMARKEEEKARHIEQKREEKRAEARAATAKEPKKSAKQLLNEKREAEARAADAAKAAETKPETPTPAPATPSVNGIDPKTGFKARPTTVKINPPKPMLRGGIGG